MKFILTIFILVLTLSTFGQASGKLGNYTPTTFYKGKAFNLDLFVKTNDSIAVMDWFYQEGVPRCFFSDTLLKCSNNDTIWKSSISKIYLSKKQLYLYTANSPYEPNKGVRVKLKAYKIENWENEYFKTKKFYSTRCVKR
jgi:hypothetical protein